MLTRLIALSPTPSGSGAFQTRQQINIREHFWRGNAAVILIVALHQPGTNLNAWLFTILRNGFYSQHRKKRREVEDPDGFFAGRLRTAPEQNAKCDVQDMLKAFRKLRVEHREALLLIVAEGLSYEDAAHVAALGVV